MLRNKCSAKKTSSSKIIIEGVVMKPDWIGTFMSMRVNQVLMLSRPMTTIGRVRTIVSRINSKTDRRYVVTSEDMDERFTVKREA